MEYSPALPGEKYYTQHYPAVEYSPSLPHCCCKALPGSTPQRYLAGNIFKKTARPQAKTMAEFVQGLPHQGCVGSCRGVLPSTT